MSSHPVSGSFRARVLAWVRRIPCGRVVTYGQIAALAGAPKRARQVGAILRSAGAPLPWHRVINRHGRISLPQMGGYEVQRALLQQEGVHFDERDTVDLLRFGWRPSPHGSQSK